MSGTFANGVRGHCVLNDSWTVLKGMFVDSPCGRCLDCLCTCSWTCSWICVCDLSWSASVNALCLYTARCCFVFHICGMMLRASSWGIRSISNIQRLILGLNKYNILFWTHPLQKWFHLRHWFPILGGEDFAPARSTPSLRRFFRGSSQHHGNPSRSFSRQSFFLFLAERF